MQFNIASRLDIEFFNRKFDSACSELRSDFYIFMSPDTITHMPQLDDDGYIGVSMRNKCTERVGSYHGHKVFSDPSMKYGDVEFR